MYHGKFERTPSPAPARQKQGLRLGGLVFYTLFSLCLLVFWLGTYSGLRMLEGWLRRYEAAQPDTVCRSVFDSLFSQPDWGVLYDRAGLESGAFENKSTFVSWMEARTRGSELTYLETSAGLSEDRKYIVSLNDEKIAAFTLTNRAEDTNTEIPDWQLGTLEFFTEGTQNVRIRAPEDVSVLVNGRELPQEHVISRRVPLTQDYLPVGIAAPAEVTYLLSGLLTTPEVTAADRDGTTLSVLFDEESDVFSVIPPEVAIGQEERDTALNAARTYALYMIKKASAADLAKYFNRSSDTYRAITGAELGFVQSAAKQEFTQEQVSDYIRYSEDLFSVRIRLNLKQTRRDGTVKDNPVDQSLFFSRDDRGRWLCYFMTAVDTNQARELVRLTFREGDTLLQDGFVDANSASVQCPVPEVPEGKSFGGWFTEETGPEGKTVLRLVLRPDASGLAELPEDALLAPMVLYPLYE